MADPIADMLTRIKNAAARKKRVVVIPYGTLAFHIATVLMKKGFLDGVERKTRKIGKRSYKNLELHLAFAGDESKVHDIRRVSKGSRRVYRKKNDLYPVKNGFGVAVVSTSRGVMSDKEARKAGIGGEVIAEVW